MASRNRPRSSFQKEDIADELNLWNSIVDKIRRCSAIAKKSDDIAKGIPTAEERVGESDPSSMVDQLEQLEKLHRNGLKYAEDELNILHEEPEDLIKNLETLISVRAAFEIETPRSAGAPKPRPMKRRLEADGPADSPAPSDAATPVPPSRIVSKPASRSASVTAPSIKSEAEETVKGVVFEKKEKFPVGSEVFYKNKAKGADGEGILCTVTNVIGEGKQRRYEVQDLEPEVDEQGNMPGAYRASVQLLSAIPPANTQLPDLPKGKQVVAVYPLTTTFYKAEVVGMRPGKNVCRLRFDGEEEKGKEQDVERRYVLDKL